MSLADQPNDHLRIIFKYLGGFEILMCLSVSKRVKQFAMEFIGIVPSWMHQKLRENLAIAPRCTNLTVVNLNRCNVVSLESLCVLTQLEELDVSFNMLANLNGLNQLVNLKSLNIEGNQLTDEALSQITPLANLKKLSLGYDDITQSGLRHLRGLRLTSLTIWNMEEIEDTGFLHICSIRTLKTLSMPECGIQTVCLGYLPNMQLTKLNVCWSHVGEWGLFHIREMSSLEVLEIEANTICDEGAAHLSGMQNLKTLLLVGDIVKMDRIRELLPNISVQKMNTLFFMNNELSRSA